MHLGIVLHYIDINCRGHLTLSFDTLKSTFASNLRAQPGVELGSAKRVGRPMTMVPLGYLTYTNL